MTQKRSAKGHVPEEIHVLFPVNGIMRQLAKGLDDFGIEDAAHRREFGLGDVLKPLGRGAFRELIKILRAVHILQVLMKQV